jgi:hypothetical protein
MFIGNSMKERLLRSIIREELKRLTEFAPGKFSNISLDASESDKSMSDIEVSKALDNALKGRHASGRPFSSQFRSSLHENIEEDSIVDYGKLLYKMNNDLKNKDIFKKFDGAGPYYNQLFKVDYKKIDTLKKSGQINPNEMKILQSIMLFTGGNVTSVRDPKRFDPKLTANTEIELFNNLHLVTKETYETANKILSSLAISKNYFGFNKIFRGLNIEDDIASNLRPGIEFNNWPISSFTKVKDVALGFSIANNENQKQVLIVINNPSHGSDISKFSNYPNEQEVVLGKKILIKKIRSDQFENFDEYFLEIECDVIP